MPTRSRLKIVPFSRMRITARSPWRTGSVLTRTSISRPAMRVRMRPSWGTRFSAMFSPAMIFTRLMMEAWSRGGGLTTS